MSEEITSLPPLTLNLKTVDTSYPTLAVGQHVAVIESVVVKQSENKPGLYMLQVKLVTEEAASSAQGKVLNPGFKFNANIVLPGGPVEATEKMTAEQIEELRTKNLCVFIDGAFNTTQETRPDNIPQPDEFRGKKLIVVITKNKDTTYGETQVNSFKAIQS